MAAIVVICKATLSTCIRGYHVYHDKWVPVLDKMLSCCREFANVHYPFAVKVMTVSSTIGHLPKKISYTRSLFIMKGRVILYRVTVCFANCIGWNFP